jgi:hypothetical protein
VAAEALNSGAKDGLEVGDISVKLNYTTPDVIKRKEKLNYSVSIIYSVALIKFIIINMNYLPVTTMLKFTK